MNSGNQTIFTLNDKYVSACFFLNQEDAIKDAIAIHWITAS